MRNRLDLIESRLQALIESSVALLARGDAQHRLAHQLVAAALESIANQPEERAIAPNHYTIYLQPDSLAYWYAHRDRLDSIGRSLQDAAREYGVSLGGEPILQLAPDPDLTQEGIRVEADYRPTTHLPNDDPASRQTSTPGPTAAISVARLAPPLNRLPANAFLIVEGKRIYPLIQTVINIGRRADNHLVLQDRRVSRSHAQIRTVRGQYVLFDLNSSGGTLVNGRRVNQAVLKPGDVISLSGVPLIYGEDSPPEEEDSDSFGYTQSMHQRPDLDPPEVIE